MVMYHEEEAERTGQCHAGEITESGSKGKIEGGGGAAVRIQVS